MVGPVETQLELERRENIGDGHKSQKADCILKSVYNEFKYNCNMVFGSLTLLHILVPCLFELN